ncbi:hypothetical protein [Streptomyces sp. NPDC053560]|uniref:hypothetical protein n=1 Tax=Streptomyces sp. NPDC053560 TaxID=3365711 RepID=UPI0037D6587E
MPPACFGLSRWLLAPRTTFRARRLRLSYPQLSSDQAWLIARLYRHPDEVPYAQDYLRRHTSGPQG